VTTGVDISKEDEREGAWKMGILRRREVPWEFETRHGANNADAARFVIFRVLQMSVSEGVWVLLGSMRRRRRKRER
jgi:hypothetical protein